MHLIQKITLFFMLVASTLALPMQRAAMRFMPMARTITPQLKSAATLSRFSSLLGSQNLAQKAAKPQVLKAAPKLQWQQNNQWQQGKQDDKKEEPKFGKKPFAVLPPLLGVTVGLSVYQPDEDTLIFSIGDDHIDRRYPEISKKHAKDMEGIIALLKSTGLPVFMHIELKDYQKTAIKNPAFSSNSATMDVVMKHAVDHDMQENNIHYQSFDIRDHNSGNINALIGRAFTFNGRVIFSWDGVTSYIDTLFKSSMTTERQIAQGALEKMPISLTYKEMLSKKSDQLHAQSLNILQKMKNQIPITSEEGDILLLNTQHVAPDIVLAQHVMDDIAKPGKKIIVALGGAAHMDFLAKALESKNIGCTYKAGCQKYLDNFSVWGDSNYISGYGYLFNNYIYNYRHDKPFTITPTLKPIIEKFQNKK